MLAAVFHENGGPEVVGIEEVEMPRPGPGEVLVRVEASSLNHLDLWLRRGLPIDVPMPHIGGSDIAGVVADTGHGVERTWQGKRVVVDPSVAYHWYDLARWDGPKAQPYTVLGEHTQGGFAQYCVVPAANLVEVPRDVSPETAAAAALAGVTAWRGLISRGGLTAGQRVLVTGASGGVSTLAIQYAKAAGAEVYALTSPKFAKAVRELGADHVFDRTVPSWSRDVYRATGKRGVDLCLDSVGKVLFGQLVRILAVGGRLVCFGATTGHEGAIDLRVLFWRQLSVMGSTMGTPAEFRAAMHHVFAGSVTPPIHEVLPLAEARKAHEMLESGQVFGKIVLRP